MKELDALLSVIAGFFGAMVSSYVPGEYSFKVMCGQVVTSVMTYVSVKAATWLGSMKTRRTRTTTPELFVGADHTLFQRFDDYFISQFSDQTTVCELLMKKGAIGQAVRPHPLDKKFTDSYEDHPIHIQIVNSSTNSTASYRDHDNDSREKHVSGGDRDGQFSFRDVQYKITSPTATIQDLVRYATSKCETRLSKTERVVKMYRIATVSKRGRSGSGLRSAVQNVEHDSLDWEEIEERCNRTTTNVIPSANVRAEFYGDVAEFLGNSAWYHERGIPYRRGFVLHGKPGTAKTSSVMALANEHGMPLFMMDLAVINSGIALQGLLARVSALTRGSPHLVLYDDVDRSGVIDQHRNHRSDINMGTLLNAIDGAGSGSGRITVLAVNDRAGLDSVDHNALVRPGRIDRVVEFLTCDRDHVEAMFRAFYCGSDLEGVFRWESVDDSCCTASLADSPEQIESRRIRGYVRPENIGTNTGMPSCKVMQAMIIHKEDPRAAFGTLFPNLKADTIKDDSGKLQSQDEPHPNFNTARRPARNNGDGNDDDDVCETYAPVISMRNLPWAYQSIMKNAREPQMAYVAIKRLHMQKMQSKQVLKSLRTGRENAQKFLDSFKDKETVWLARENSAIERLDSLRKMAMTATDPCESSSPVPVAKKRGRRPTSTAPNSAALDRQRQALHEEVSRIALSDSPVPIASNDTEPVGDIVVMAPPQFGSRFKIDAGTAKNMFGPHSVRAISATMFSPDTTDLSNSDSDVEESI